MCWGATPNRWGGCPAFLDLWPGHDEHEGTPDVPGPFPKACPPLPSRRGKCYGWAAGCYFFASPTFRQVPATKGVHRAPPRGFLVFFLPPLPSHVFFAWVALCFCAARCPEVNTMIVFFRQNAPQGRGPSVGPPATRASISVPRSLRHGSPMICILPPWRPRWGNLVSLVQ